MAEGDPIIVPAENITTQPTQEGGATGAQAQQPVFDASILQQSVSDAIKSGFQGFAQQFSQQQVPVQPQQPQADPLAGVLQPHLQPLTQVAQGAYDASVFYATTPAAAQYAQKIEELARQYPTTPRASLWQFMRGSDEYINAQIEARMNQQKAAADAAALGSAVGVGSPNRAFGEVKQAREMSPDDLSRALDGVSF